MEEHARGGILLEHYWYYIDVYFFLGKNVMNLGVITDPRYAATRICTVAELFDVLRPAWRDEFGIHGDLLLCNFHCGM